MAVCRDFQCKFFSSVKITFFTAANKKHRYRAWLLVLRLVWHWHSLLMFAFSWMHEGGASSTFAVCCSMTRQWYVPFDADFCDFLVYFLVTDKAVQHDRSFRQSSRSWVFRCPSCGQYCPFDDASLELDWCFGNSISYSEILLQSEYQSILFSETRRNNRQIVLWKKPFQLNQQIRYLHNLIFTWCYVIIRHSVTSLMTSLKFISK